MNNGLAMLFLTENYFISCLLTFCGFVSVCPCTRLKFTEKLNGANSTKPLLSAGGLFSTKLQSKHGNFLFFCAVGKIILIENQRLRKYFKNSCSKTCVYL